MRFFLLLIVSTCLSASDLPERDFAAAKMCFESDFDYSCGLSDDGEEGGTENGNIDSTPSLMIESVVCPLSGDISLSHLDAQVIGVAPISLDRAYNSSYHKKLFHPQMWVTSYYGAINLKIYELNKKKFYGACFCGPYKQKIFFYSELKKSPDYKKFVFNEYQFDKGLSNLGGREMSGRSHPKNAVLTGELKNQEHVFKLVMGSGLKIKFAGNVKKPPLIMKEQVLPNSHHYFFESDHKNRTTKIRAATALDKTIATANFVYNKNETLASLSNGAKVRYIYDDKKLVSVESSEAPTINYEYKKKKLIKKSLPDGRYHRYEYFDRAKYFDDYGRPDTRDGRVKKLIMPSHTNGEECVTHQLDYYSCEVTNEMFKTTCLDWAGYKLDYNYTFGRIDTHKRYEKDQKTIHTKECFYWGDLGTPIEGNLLSRVLVDKHENILWSRTYAYDAKANLTKECLYGDITGNNDNKSIEINRGYIGSKNLLQWQDDGRKRIYYSYYKNTDLIEKTLISSKERIHERHFFIYDENLALVCEMADDGSGLDVDDLTDVTERKIQRRFYHNSLNSLPDREDELYYDLELGQERLISRKETVYDQRGRTLYQKYYDKDGEFAFDRSWEYNAHGHVTREIDPMGYEMHRKFDANGNLIEETGPLFDSVKSYTYDVMNRMINLKEQHGSEVLTTHYKYDPLGRKISEVNPYGSETKIVYDIFGREVEMHMPPVEGEDGEPFLPVWKKSYNLLDHVTEVIDPEGRRTHISTTIQGQSKKIVYADDSNEEWRYNIYGEKVFHKATNGSFTEYERDWKGRIVKQETFSSDGELLNSTEAKYNNFHVLAQSDELGVWTNYTYDNAGRLIQTTKDNLAVKFEYDASGQVIKKITNDLLVEKFAYDKLGRIVEESQEEINGTVHLYKRSVYDALGRKIAEVNKGETTFFNYNSKGELTSQIDPLGRIISHDYDHHYINKLGQRVLRVVTTDVTGATLEVVSDSAGRPKVTTKKDRFGSTLQESELFYNTLGKVIRSVQSVFYKGEKEREFIVDRDFDILGRQIAIKEGVDTPLCKISRVAYNAIGQKIKLIKPDGVEINYIWDACGRLKEEISSDKTLHYGYTYDKASRLIEVKDFIQNNISKREYDLLGRLTHDKLGTGHEVAFQYDLLGRVCEIQHNNQDPVNYTYDACFLREVKWKNKAASYEDYDLTGKLIQGDGLHYEYDKMGRQTAWRYKDYSEKSLFNVRDHLIERELCEEKTHYTYDELDQLTAEKGKTESTYAHDSLYNRRLKNDAVSEVNVLNQQISSGDIEYEWDRNGNRTARIEQGKRSEFIYDARDRLIETHIDGKTVKHIWDWDNRRLKKNDIEYLYQQQNEVGSYDQGKIVDFRVLGLGKGAEIGASVWMQVQGEIYKPLHDSSGHVIALLDKSDHCVQSYRYTSFGEETLHEQNLSNRWRFASKTFDEETNLTQFGRRFYDAEAGRFITGDPKGYETGPNLYAYCFNSPLTHWDLYGLETVGSVFPEQQKGGDSATEQEREKKEEKKEEERKLKLSENGAIATIQCLGYGIEFVNHHLIPHFPIVKDILKAPAHFMQHGTMSNYVPVWSETHSQWVVTGYKESNGELIPIEITGILTSFFQSYERGQRRSDALEGETTYTFATASHGLVADLCSCFIEKLRIPTNASRTLQKGFEELSQRYGSASCEISVSAFSRGSLLMRNVSNALSRNEGISIRLVALGSPVIHNPDNYSSVYQPLSNNDGVGILCGPGRFFPPEHVEIIKSDTLIPFADHTFDNKIYSNCYKKNVIEYEIKKLGLN